MNLHISSAPSPYSAASLSRNPSATLPKDLAFSAIVGGSPVMKDLIAKAKEFALCDFCVLIFGETGTGKELLAHGIHLYSSRCSHPFIAVNCGELPVELAENELYGHDRGAYTGATQAQEGLIAAAEGGTLFLDEIAPRKP